MNKFLITYCGQASSGVWYIPYKAIVSSVEEAEKVINSWHSYGGRNNCSIILNEKCREKLADWFENGFGLAPSGSPYRFQDFRTTGCGSWCIRVYPALADTLEEHERIYREKLEVEKAERLRKAEEAKEQKMQDFHVQRKGWYYVEVEVCGLTMDNMRPRYITSSGYGIANSKMDAYNKFLWDGNTGVVNLLARKSLTFSHASEWNSSSTVVEFLGMKTDEGYSLKAWEEAKENGEI